VSIPITQRTPHHSMQCVTLQETTLVTAPLLLQHVLYHQLHQLHQLHHLVSTIFVYTSLFMHIIIATPVLEVFTNTVTNTSITLRWVTSNTPGIIYYNISYTAVISFNTEKGEIVTYPVRKVVNTTATSFSFEPLNPSTKYTFTVTAYTNNGPGPSYIITESTTKGRTGNLL